MDDKYKYFDMAIDYYTKLNKSKKFRIIKKLFYSTQLKGPHIDFYHYPYGLNKSSPLDNFKKFQIKIIKSINHLLICETQKLFLNKHVIFAMIEQINNVLNENDQYWLNYEFSEYEVSDIKKTYTMYKLFLETYVNRLVVIRLGDTEIGEELYKTCIKSNLSVNISPNQLQLFGIKRAKQVISIIESEFGMSIFDVINKYKNEGTPIQSETELISSCMSNIMELSNYVKQICPNIIVPETHKIKIKEIPQLRSKWSSKAKVSGRYLFLNMSNVKSYKKESLMRLCAHEVISGHIMYRTNSNIAINDYFAYCKQYNKKCPKQTKRLMKSGIKALHEGFASYAETMMLEMYKQDKIYLYLSQLFHAVRIILDTGLNSSKVKFKFDKDSATKILKMYTLLNDNGINSEIHRYLANPAQACAYGFGYYCIKKMEEEYTKHNKPLSDFYSDIYKLPLPLPILAMYTKNLHRDGKLDRFNVQKIDDVNLLNG